MELKKTFNGIVDDYEYARPGYPEQLFKDIIEYSGITRKNRVLEVGAGTGQATSYFASMNYPIDALEIGNEQVLYLTKKYKENKNVHIMKSSFEEYGNTYQKTLTA